MLQYEFIDPDIQVNSIDFRFIESFLKMTDRTQIGWHYITDITWIYSHIKDWLHDFKILDVGGGGGPVQFLLAELGFDVTNVDLSLTEPNVSFKKRYRITYNTLPSFKSTSYEDFLKENRNISFGQRAVKDMIKKSWFYELWSAKRYEKKHKQ